MCRNFNYIKHINVAKKKKKKINQWEQEKYILFLPTDFLFVRSCGSVKKIKFK